VPAVHVLGFTGPATDGWPHPGVLRVVGRSRDEAHHPMHLLNRGEVVDVTLDPSSLAPAPPDLGPWRWDLDGEAQATTCLSCAAEAVAATEVANDGTVRLFQHRAAVEPGLLIVSPVRHVERLEDLRREEGDALAAVIDAVDRSFRHELDAAGTWFVLNDGPEAGQETPHVHVHLWARRAGEPANPFASGVPRGMGRPTPDRVAELRARAARQVAATWPASGSS
jgi:diadenosine tetraphosphate (Ap4A) HIT family hydrolase